ncbi:hypothetical protein GmHk_20G057637 [Glycine max]|nr:hypothetical protein GmHk_20G057637 [Glycine max]
MYDNLNIVFKHTTKHLVGYITLLQSWIYEHFPTIANIIVDEDYHEKKPHACRWKCGKTLPVTTYHKRLDRKTPNAICWIPYGYHHAFKEFKLISLFFRHIRWGSSIVRHQPKKFGYVQSIPLLPTAPSLSTEEIDDRWLQFSQYLAPCALGYIEWFYMIFHPFMSSPQLGEALRLSPMVHDDTYIIPNPPMFFVHIAVCQKIAENLEHMVNMRMVTVGTNAYAITEHYLTLSKVVIEQGNVYVCSRQRRDTQDKSHGGLGS